MFCGPLNPHLLGILQNCYTKPAFHIPLERVHVLSETFGPV